MLWIRSRACLGGHEPPLAAVGAAADNGGGHGVAEAEHAPFSPPGPSAGVYCWHRMCTRLHKKMAEKGKKTTQQTTQFFGCSPSAVVLL